MKIQRFIPVAIIAGMFAAPKSAFACKVCMGDPNSQMAVASDSTLLMLLAMVGFILVATASTAYYLYHHAKKAGSTANFSE